MVEFADIVAALKIRYAEYGHSDAAFRIAAMRVHHNLEAEGPVSEEDRLFFDPNEQQSDVDILIDRTLFAIDERNAARAEERRGPT